ncbi:unnamed protein product [Spirodela intermedia]|uniref:AB hydrolase-1 domain-containing protein n=1 Tax=Spirodela intermedia TaxID=51605 RepID=A0ABN7EDM1_SPIIN|nr:unnamed protein product [Spirodela intermedia]
MDKTAIFQELSNARLNFIFFCVIIFWLTEFFENGLQFSSLSGESDLPMDAIAGSLQTHTSDLADFIRKELEIPPVLVGHSFGGLIVQSYISHAGAASSVSHALNQVVRKDSRAMLAGAVLLCSWLVWRYLLSNPVAAFKVTLRLAAKAFANSLPLCKETFSPSTMDDGEVQRYQNLMKQSSRVPLRRACFILGVEPVCLEGGAHDMMLVLHGKRGRSDLVLLKNLN